MTDEKNEHIDQYFRDHFDEVDVSYNPAHWDQLSQALAAAAVTGVGLATSQSALQRIMQVVRQYRNVVLLTVLTVALIAMAILFFNTETTFNPSPVVPAEQIIPVTNGIISDSAFNASPEHIKDSLRKAGVVPMQPVDTLVPNIVVPVDTIDSLRVDSLKGFLFW